MSSAAQFRSQRLVRGVALDPWRECRRHQGASLRIYDSGDAEPDRDDLVFADGAHRFPDGVGDDRRPPIALLGRPVGVQFDLDVLVTLIDTSRYHREVTESQFDSYRSTSRVR